MSVCMTVHLSACSAKVVPGIQLGRIHSLLSISQYNAADI